MAEFSSSVGGGAIGANITIRNASTNSVNNVAELRLKTAHGVARFYKYNTGSTVIQSHTSGASDLLLYADGASNLRLHTNAVERLRIDSSGRVIVGSSSDILSNNLLLQAAATNATGSLFLGRFGDSIYGSYVRFGKSRNGTIGSHTIVQTNDILGAVDFTGSDGSNLQTGARIQGVVDGTPGSSDMPGRIEFHTTPDGSTTVTERLRIASNGQVSISSDGTTDGLLTIKGNSDQVTTPSIRLLDGSDTREVSITNTSGDFVVSVHGNDNAIHGHIKMFESGIIDFNNGGASGSNVNRLRINSSGSLLTPNGSPLMSKGSNSQQNGGYEVYNDQHLVETNDSTNSFHVMRSWTATKFGEFRVEAEMMIVAGTYYFIYDVYNATRGERISAAGSGNHQLNNVNASRWVDHLESGFASNVHGMRRFTVRCGQNYPVQPGDTIQLRMASSTGSGGLVTGNGQGLRCEHLQIFNDTPDLETGGRGFQPSAVAFHVVMQGQNQSFSSDLTWNNGYTAFNRGYRRSTVSGNPVNAGFDIANSRFIVPYTGIYAFYFNAFVNTASDCRMAVTINGSAYQSGYIWGCNSSEGQATPNQAGFQTLYLGEGANIKLKIVSGTLSNTYGGHTSWGGWLIG